MKRIILLFIVVLCTVFTSEAQTRFGAKAGIEGSKIKNLNSDSKTRVPSFMAGVFAQFTISDTVDQTFFKLNTELLYSAEGEKSGDLKCYLDFVNVPIMFRVYHQFNNLTSQIYGELGPQFGVLIKDSKKTEGGFEANKFNMSLCFGFGVAFGKKSQYEVGGRVSVGMLDLYSDKEKKQWNMVGAVNFAYYFN